MWGGVVKHFLQYSDTPGHNPTWTQARSSFPREINGKSINHSRAKKKTLQPKIKKGSNMRNLTNEAQQMKQNIQPAEGE